MADYQLQDIAYQVNYAAARIAREVADKWTSPDKPRFVAGSMGPTNRSCSISPDVNDPGVSEYYLLTTRFCLYNPSRGFN